MTKVFQKRLCNCHCGVEGVEDPFAHEQYCMLRMSMETERYNNTLSKVIDNQKVKEIAKNYLKMALDSLDDYDRAEIFDNYCKHCGSKDTGCRCWDDS